MGICQSLVVGITSSVIGSAIGGGIGGLVAGYFLVHYQMSQEIRSHDAKVLCEIFTVFERLERVLSRLIHLQSEDPTKDISSLIEGILDLRSNVPANNLLSRENESLKEEIKRAIQGPLPDEAKRMHGDVQNLMNKIREWVKTQSDRA